MRNLLALLAFAVLAFAGAGWYLGWYKVRTEPTADGQRKIITDVNTPKIANDLNKGKEKLRDFLTKKEGGDNQQNVTPRGTPPITVPASFTPPEEGTFVYPPTDPSPFPPLPPGIIPPVGPDN